MKASQITTLIAVTVLVATYALLPRTSPATTLHLAGDSTMAVQSESRRPLTGWGEPFELMLCEHINLINHAKNGRSSKSFLAEGLWDALLADVRPADIVLIQFGHNDQKIADSARYTSPWTEYRENLQRFVSDISALDAKPVLLTSIVRRSFNRQDEIKQTHGDYPAVVRQLAEDTQLPLIDLNHSTQKLVELAGPVSSKYIYLHLQPGEHDNYPMGIQDDTHFGSAGAFEIASLAAKQLDQHFPNLICR